ncbi:PREDICTED: TPD1 protein homolog 1-like [Prunus mume]|uniref:TPD1 protein homolog 1-like n=1 Tax=Prunus mume TaxID=102107 RepID=A0ABM0NE11_PRUMU|nr:PREDICTED: TPD1 protein homolog 1-like [Prunus mume]
MVMMLMVISCNLYGAHSGGCKARDISISQGKISETGIPKYSVQIANECSFDCAASDIHVHCGQFASTEVMNPAEFRRLSFDDCLVNNGQPLKPHQLISFTYSNTFMYPLAFKSAKFIC